VCSYYSKFPEVVALLSKHIHQCIEAASNEKHGEVVLGYFNPDPQDIVLTLLSVLLLSLTFSFSSIGWQKKYVWTNAFQCQLLLYHLASLSSLGLFQT
jgi:hypothetical protein